MDPTDPNTHPALRGAPQSQGNPTAPPQPVNGDAEAPPDSPKSSRGRTSFSFLRRSKSGEPPGNPPTRSLSKGRKLVRRKSQREEEERRRLEAEAASKNIPALPTYQQLPNISNPYLIDSTQSQALNLPDHQQQYYPPPPAGPPPLSPKRWAYNPTAYYQRHQNTMDRASPSLAYGVPPPPMTESSPPGSSRNNAQPFDPYARTESMTNRGRMSYASSAISQGTNGPRRLRRRKDPTPFNVLVIGTKGCGKSSFIEFLRSSLSRPVRRFATSQISPPGTAVTEQHGSFTSHYLKTELEAERIGLTLYDSKGLERHLVDLQLREISAFLESKFQETFQEEQKVMRTTGLKDTHIHCVILLLDPSRLDSNIATSNAKSEQNNSTVTATQRVVGGLDEDLDVDVIRTLQGKTTVIPVISKADTVTTAHMAYLKRKVFESLKKIKFDPLEALNLDSDGDSDLQETDETTEQDTSDQDSSIFHDVEESNDSERLGNDQDSGSLDPSAATTKSSAYSSKPPQHGEIRVSHLSTNFESPLLPMSVISPDVYEPGTVGRRFPWGFADPYNSEHCDFSKLKDSIFSEWRSELREASRERWYEGWRTAQMKRRGPGVPQYATTPIRPGQRAVSGAAAYGHQSAATANGYANQNRVVSSGQAGVASGGIGVAIGGASHSLPTRFRTVN